MKVVLGCDVDAALPDALSAPIARDVWHAVDEVRPLVERMGDTMPPVTWLIRSDESVRFATGAYDSGYTTRAALWDRLRTAGHELGWHMHAWSHTSALGRFAFDPEPPWLGEAHAALARHAELRSTRTGWDYGSTFLLNGLRELGIRVDFSAMPRQAVWQRVGNDVVLTDWRRSPAG
ncbi:MAG: hypothetical protein ACJ8AO_21325, partial [Gemmatimonadaceae bacterium]